MERILFPDALAAVIGALGAQLPSVGFTGVPVGSKIPNPRPLRFVRVWDSGGQRVNLVTYGAQLTFDSWAADDAAARALGNATFAIVLGLQGTVTGGVTVYGVNEFAGPAYLPDPDSDQPRYRWTGSVSTRGVAA